MGESRAIPSFLLAFFLAVCAPADARAQKNKDVSKIGERDINKGSLNFYSLEREIELGKALAAEVETASRLLRDARVQGYVEDLVQSLVRNSDAQVPFTVKVIDSDELNAFALPGGFLYINTGLILEARTEAELAGVLAHEIAHVTARHTTKQATKAQLFQWASLPLIFVGGPLGYGLSQAVGVAGPLAFLKFSRNYEREADFLGVQYSYRAGYDPTAMIDFLERLKSKESESRLAQVFSSHPMTRDRIERAQKAIAGGLPARPEYVVTTSRFAALQDYLRRQQQASWLYRTDEGGPRMRRRTED